MFEKKYHTGEIHSTNKCGNFEIIEDNGVFNKHNQRIVKIKYLDTGYEDYVIYKNAIHNYDGQDKLRFMYEVKDKIFMSNNYGQYQIIEDLGAGYDGNPIVKVRFLDTGYEYITRKGAALQGKVKDHSRFIHNTENILYDSNYYGKVQILSESEYLPNDIHHQHRMVLIKFINTGTTAIVRYEDLIKGQVKDPTYRNAQEAQQINGVQPIINIKETLFGTWKGMLDRCTNKNSAAYANYGAKGITISDSWKNFDTFLYDAQHLPGWEYKMQNPLEFHIDKDLLQIDIPYNQRIYSRNTCIWLDRQNNTRIASNIPVTIYYDNIYCINDLYFVKSSPGYFSYGPYFSLYEALDAPIY